MTAESKRFTLEKKIQRYRRIAREMAADAETTKLIYELIADLEQQLRDLAD